MAIVDVSRWQFGVTTVYHFLFVPLTIGLALLVAVLQTCWYRTGHERWLRLTKFYGGLFLINFAMGVVTGIVQEFQFGMNWSSYSRFVGDIFGAPLAMEGLLAFFLESTFLGLWIFGWERLPKGIHLACIWIAAMGSVISAYFILVANSFMQWPVGYKIDPVTGRARITDFAAVLSNKVALITFAHTIVASIFTGAALMLAVAMWHLMRHARPTRTAGVAPSGDAPRVIPAQPEPESRAGEATTDVAGAPADDAAAFRSVAKISGWVTIAAVLLMFITGDAQGKIMTETQPMKMAAAEALYETRQPAPFSVLTIGTLDGSRPVWSLDIPNLLSFLATGSFGGKVQGINNIQAEYEKLFGPGNYKPIIPVTYWGFRLMIGFGILGLLVAVLALWTLRRGRTPRSRFVLWSCIVLPLLPLAGNSAGWIFTEMGRQPWIVFKAMRTVNGVSPSVSLAEVITSLSVFTVLYGVLAFVEVRLMLRAVRKGLPEAGPGGEPGGERALAFAY